MKPIGEHTYREADRLKYGHTVCALCALILSELQPAIMMIRFAKIMLTCKLMVARNKMTKIETATKAIKLKKT